MGIASIVHPYCQKVLPLTYDDSLSYMEMVEKLRYKVNEMINLFNEWEAIILELEQAIQDIPQMKEDIATLKSDVSELRLSLAECLARLEEAEKGVKENSENIVELRESINALKEYVDSSLDLFKVEVTALINSITYSYDEQIHLLALKINQIKVDLYAKFGELKARMDALDTSVINPWWQELGRLTQDDNNKKIYYDLADEVPTATEYAKMGLTADEYSSFMLRARDYARRGKKLLHFYWVYSPTQGWRQEISNVLTSIVNECKNTLTAERYQGLNYTAEEYANIGLTAFDYYSFAPETQGIFVSNGVLQSEQFALTVDDGVLEIHGADFVETDGTLEAQDN